MTTSSTANCKDAGLMHEPRMVGAETHQPKSFRGLSHGLDYGRHWHNDAIDDDEIYLSIVEGFLPREGSEQHISVAKVFRLRNPRAEGCRHDGRLDQHDSHGFLPAAIVGFVAGKGEYPPFETVHKLPSEAHRGLSPIGKVLGFGSVTGCNPRAVAS